MTTKPTIEFYSYLSSAFDFFNKRLFGNELSPVVFTVTRKKNAAGYFRKGGWLNESEQRFHEIAVNPNSFITASPLELCQTIVHEMCHQWQEDFGTPSRTCYHNTEWAEKMTDIGLKPISKNGKGTGQSVSDEPVPGDRFEAACVEFFVSGYKLALVDGSHNTGANLKMLNDIMSERTHKKEIKGDEFYTSKIKEIEDQGLMDAVSTPIHEFYDIEVPQETKESTYSKKSTYQCKTCLAKVWGAPTLSIGCLKCKTTMEIVA